MRSKNIYKVLTIILLVLSIGGGVFLVKKNQDNRSKAEVDISCPTGTHQIDLSDPCCGCQSAQYELSCANNGNPSEITRIRGVCRLERGYCFDTCSGSGHCEWYSKRDQCPGDHVFSDVDCLQNGDCCCIGPDDDGGGGDGGGGGSSGSCQPINAYIDPVSSTTNSPIVFTFTSNQGYTYIKLNAGNGATNCGGEKIFCENNQKDSNRCWWEWTCTAASQPGTYQATFSNSENCLKTASYSVATPTSIPTKPIAIETAILKPGISKVPSHPFPTNTIVPGMSRVPSHPFFPTNTPIPTNTIAPTNTPRPTSTPAPTVTPKPIQSIDCQPINSYSEPNLANRSSSINYTFTSNLSYTKAVFNSGGGAINCKQDYDTTNNCVNNPKADGNRCWYKWSCTTVDKDGQFEGQFTNAENCPKTVAYTVQSRQTNFCDSINGYVQPSSSASGASVNVYFTSNRHYSSVNLDPNGGLSNCSPSTDNNGTCSNNPIKDGNNCWWKWTCKAGTKAGSYQGEFLNSDNCIQTVSYNITGSSGGVLTTPTSKPIASVSKTKSSIKLSPTPTDLVLPVSGVEFPSQYLILIGAIVTLAGFLILL